MLRHLFGRSGPGRGGRPRFRPILEALEDRWVPSTASSRPLLDQLFNHPTFTASTVPGNGDVNPYGVAFVPSGIPSGGRLHSGNILVSNFNNSANQQGTGSTIVQITPTGKTSTFFNAGSQIGLTTALGVLPNGFVLVGSLPTTNGTSATIQAPGSLLLLDRSGNVVQTFSNTKFLDGPWDLTVVNQGNQSFAFVSDVLSGTVTRLDFNVTANSATLESATQIASGYSHTTDPNALVLGPTGLTYDPNTGLLYVASTADNAIYSISNPLFRNSDAGTGKVVFNDQNHLQGPLGLALLPNGDLVAANGDAVNSGVTKPNALIEFTPQGQFVAERQVDTASGGGGAFGLAVKTTSSQVELAAVDDINNTLETFTVNRS